MIDYRVQLTELKRDYRYYLVTTLFENTIYISEWPQNFQLPTPLAGTAPGKFLGTSSFGTLKPRSLWVCGGFQIKKIIYYAPPSRPEGPRRCPNRVNAGVH